MLACKSLQVNQRSSKQTGCTSVLIITVNITDHCLLVSSPHFVYSPLAARCLPRCHNGASCQQSNRCVCRRGFRGYRCQVSTSTLSPTGRPLSSTRPTRTPKSASAEFGNVKRGKGVSRMMSHTSPKSPQVRRTAGEVSHLQPGAGDSEEGGRAQKTLSETGGQRPLNMTENLTQLSGSNTNTPNLEPSCRSTEGGRHNPGPGEQDRVSREDNCGLRGQKGLDMMEQKKNKKEVKAGGAGRQELR